MTRLGDPQLLMQIHDELIYEIRESPHTYDNCSGSGSNSNSFFQDYDNNNYSNNGNNYMDSSSSNNSDSNSNSSSNNSNNNHKNSNSNNNSRLREFELLLKRCMGKEVMDTLGFSVPLTVTIKYGPDWGSMAESSRY